MHGYKDDYIKAAEISKVQAGRFYDDVAADYLKKYGYNTPYNGDLKDGQDVASDVDEDEDVDNLPAEEGEARSAYYNELRTVRLWVWIFRGRRLTFVATRKLARGSALSGGDQ
jgi:hypothetical protein